MTKVKNEVATETINEAVEQNAPAVVEKVEEPTVDQKMVTKFLGLTPEMVDMLIEGGAVDEVTASAYRLALRNQEITEKHKTHCAEIQDIFKKWKPLEQKAQAVVEKMKAYTDETKFHTQITIDCTIEGFSIHCGANKVRSIGTRSSGKGKGKGNCTITCDGVAYESWSGLLKSIGGSPNGDSGFRVVQKYFDMTGAHAWSDKGDDGKKKHKAAVDGFDYDLVRNSLPLEDKHKA